MEEYYRYMAEYHKLLSFGFGYNKEDLLKNAKGIKVIQYGDDEFPFFNIWFLNDMLAQIMEVLYQGYIPRIELTNRKEGYINWGDYFEQPFYEFDKSLLDKLPVEYLEKRVPSIWSGLRYEACFDEQERALATKMYIDWAVINDKAFSYIQQEYAKILNGKRALGVLCRGTDMVDLKLKNHPIQPDIEEVISVARDYMKELNCSHIYLATEDEKIFERFEKEFPNQILTNEREYIDKDYEQIKTDNTYIADVLKKKNENYYFRGLHYLSSLILLSQCKGLVAGNCGGSEAALYFNEFSYEKVKIFNCGLY